MMTLRFWPALAAAAVLVASGSALAQVQSAKPSSSAPRAPGVTRAVAHPDSAKPDRSSADSTVDQTQPDSHQPETAVDKGPAGPETAKDDQKHQPETASDKPTAPSSSQKAAAIAGQGVRSNTPPSAPPKG
jgi:hypothetical protein